MSSTIWHIEVEYEIYNINIDRRTKKPKTSSRPIIKSRCRIPTVVTDPKEIQLTPRLLNYILKQHNKTPNGAKVKVLAVEKLESLGHSNYY